MALRNHPKTSHPVTMSDGGALPQEIITVILSRLPFKSLSRFKCVSPSWKTLISSPHFAQTRHNYRPFKAILFTRSFDLYSVDFADANPTPKKLDHPPFNHMSDSRSVSSCNGLVLVSDQGYVNFLLNPSTSEWKELPAPFHTYSSMDIFYPPGLGFVASSGDYKVVIPFFEEGLGYPLGLGYPFTNEAAVTIVAVYSLKNNAWRTIQDFHYRPVERLERRRGVCFNERRPVERGRGVCFNERLHWLCRRTGPTDYSTVVVAIDLADEIFREVQLPASYDDNKFRGHDMVVLEGCLCLLVWLKSDRIDVWMMMEYGVRESWKKFFSIANPGMSIGHVLCLSAQDELVLMRERFTSIRGSVEDEFDGEKLILCNPIQGTLREVVVSGIPTTSLVGNHYIETLSSPNHGGRISETM